MSKAKSLDASASALTLAADGPDAAALPAYWFVQDAAGFAWLADLAPSLTAGAARQLLSTHAGAITGLVASPVTHVAASCGADGRVMVREGD